MQFRTLNFHHIAIQASNLAKTVPWYQDFFRCQINWELDRFSSLTLSRLPGIVKLVELQIDDVRFHIFERVGLTRDERARNTLQFQHFCLQVSSPEELRFYRSRWIDLYQSQKYIFEKPELPTEIVVDGDGVETFYFYDVNGLEYEMSYMPVQQE